MTIRRRLALLLIAAMTAMGLVTISGTSAQALTSGNKVVNSIYSLPGGWILYEYWYDGSIFSAYMYPGQSSSSKGTWNVQCFTPRWPARNMNTGYIYNGGQKRCFETNGNTLLLQVGV